MFRIVSLLLSSSVLFSCIQKQEEVLKLPYYNTADFTPLFMSEEEAAQKITHTISDFRFLNQDSVWISNTSIEGKIHAANFIFTRCGSICPVMTNNFKFVANEFNHDSTVALLSYSVTPWIDEPHVLKKYRRDNSIQNPNWHFLTGDKAAIYTLARTSYFAEEDIGFSKDSNQFLHTEHVILVDKNKRIRGVYNGTLELEMQQLMDDINALKREED
ncbi:SCO family protein [Cytophaga aurantiaca]|uniref:SCO family protein n=1 Tax=Cytophaga aurantiaca TaxID=29530 RepID=UPI00036BA445|nr:SCO family protein [Cytophaga aurantiaca]